MEHEKKSHPALAIIAAATMALSATAIPKSAEAGWFGSSKNESGGIVGNWVRSKVKERVYDSLTGGNNTNNRKKPSTSWEKEKKGIFATERIINGKRRQGGIGR